jgi:hypothetical protein
MSGARQEEFWTPSERVREHARPFRLSDATRVASRIEVASHLD